MKQTLVLTLLLAMLLGVACDRYIDSRDPVRSLPDPLAAPINLVAALNDQAVQLSWEIADTSVVSRFRVYAADSADGEYTLRDSTTQFQQPVTGLLVNQTDKAIDLLSKNDYLFDIMPVMALELENRPGTLAAIASKFGQEGININYVYGTVSSPDEKCLFVFCPEDIELAAKIFKE